MAQSDKSGQLGRGSIFTVFLRTSFMDYPLCITIKSSVWAGAYMERLTQFIFLIVFNRNAFIV